MKQIALESISVKVIKVGENTRTTINKEALKELTENIKVNGVLEPIVVSKTENGYTLVAGTRRLTAAKDAGLTVIPCSVMELTQDEADRVQAIENLHREDLNAMDEADMFSNLLMANKKIPDLAAELNKTVKYITRSLSLLQLPKSIMERIKKGTLLPEHGHMLVRVVQLDNKDKLEKVIQYLGTNPEYTPKVAHLRDFINNTFTKSLKDAIFDQTDCKSCPKCAKNQSMLFNTVLEQTCDDAVCYRKKTDAHRKALAEKLSSNGKKGMKYLGAKAGSRNYNDEYTRIGDKGIVVNEKMLKSAEIKKAMEKTPEKFGFIISTEDNKPHAVIIDKELMAKFVKPEKTKKPYDYEKERFLDNKHQTRMIEELRNNVKKAKTSEMVLTILSGINLRNATWMAFLGTEEPKAKDIATITPAKMIEMLWVDSVITTDDQKARKALFVKYIPSYEKIAKEILDAATTEYKTLNAAELKKKETTGAKETTEDADEGDGD